MIKKLQELIHQFTDCPIDQLKFQIARYEDFTPTLILPPQGGGELLYAIR